MKTTLRKRALAFVLVLAMLLPSLVNMAELSAYAAGDSVYAEPVVYDIYDLTGSATNTIKGTDETWEGQLIGKVSAEHKENIVFKTRLTMGAQQVRLAINAKEGTSIYDPPGYAVYINDNNGSPYIAIKRNQQDLVVGSVAVQGTYELEIGLQDILTNGVRTGKHIYVKKDGTMVCEADDVSGYLTGDSLGTRIVDFHYGAAIQMDTTKNIDPTEPTEPEATEPLTTAEAMVYDIYDLTGLEANTIAGTDAGAWDGQIHKSISPEHKENMAFRTKLTMGAQEVRLSLNAKEGASVWDPPGYAVYLYGGDDRIQIRRNNSCLKEAVAEGLAGTYVFEAGIVDILQNGSRVGKRLYVKIGDEVVCEYDDMNGYLTGDSLGTKIVDFHYGAAIQMNTTKEIEPPEPTEPEITEPVAAADATVYDLYALKGVAQLEIAGQLQGVWGTTLGQVSESHKANVAFASHISIDEPQTIMLGLGLTDLSQAVQVNSGYVLEIVNQTGEGELDTVKIHRAGTQIYIQNTDMDFHGEHDLEYGVVDLIAGDAVVGKRIYVKLDGVEIICFDDTANFLTADQLGTKVDIYVSGNDLLLGKPRNFVAGKANAYDLYDLQGAQRLNVQGRATNPDNWSTTLGNMPPEHKENMAFKSIVTMDEAQTVMLGIGLADMSLAVQLNSGYVLEIVMKTGEGEVDTVKLHRAGTQLYCADQSQDFNGKYELEFGAVELYDADADNKVVGKRIYVKIDGEEVLHYDDTINALSGDNLGTKVDVYASGVDLPMASYRNFQYGTPEVYDIYDLLGRATVKLNHTDAGGAIIWTNVLGQIPDDNSCNFALRANMDTSKVDRKAMQELILGLCKGSDLFDKIGYRLSMYFATDGGISVVLRDSATDEVLASVDDRFPEKVEIELGVTSFYESSKGESGKKIYLKVDGEEILSYLDKAGNRAWGNLLCAYTTSPVTLSTKYDYFTIPVTYVVNGETVESSEYIVSNTDAVAGKKSIIDITLAKQDAYTSVVMEKVLLNGQRITPVSDKQNVYTFELENPTKDDELTVEIAVHNLTVDEADVYDLYELTGKKKIVLPAYSVDQIGTLFADGQEGVLNRAIRFAYYIPQTGGGLRLGYGSDTSDIWSRVGTHIEIWCGFATISHGFHVSALSTGSTDIFKPDSWSIVEVGIVKCYEDGVYKYDRWYVKAGESLDEMELITYYDSTQRHDSTLNIMARTPDTGDDFILASTLDVRQVTDISEEDAKAEAEVAFKPLFLKGETVKIAVFPMEGKKLESLHINGETVETVLNSDGSFVFVQENAQEDIAFRYILSDDDSVYKVTADAAEHLEFTLEKAAVTAGGSAAVQIKMDGGYTLKSLTVNGVDFLPMASFDKTTLTYTLTISHIREDKHIQAEAEKLSQDGPVAENAGEGNKINLPVILAVAAVSAAALCGAVVMVAARARKKGRKQ